MRGGIEHFGISECRGGDKMSMPPVVGVWIILGTTHSVTIKNNFCSCLLSTGKLRSHEYNCPGNLIMQWTVIIYYK